MRGHLSLLRVLLGALCLGHGSLAGAGALSVAPVRIELSDRHPIATLEIRNEGDSASTVQLERLLWTQHDGADDYAPTTALIATPAVFRLEPGASQTVRLGLRAAGSLSTKQAFRLYACEVPTGDTAGDDPRGTGLTMALRIGIPIFVAPPNAETHLVADILRSPDGRATLRLANEGNRSAKTVGIEITDDAGTRLWRSGAAAYVLAGGEHAWTLDAAGAVLPEGPLNLSVVTDSGISHITTRSSR